MKEAVLMDIKDNVATLLQRVEGGQEVAVIKSNRTVIKNIIVTEDPGTDYRNIYQLQALSGERATSK